MAILQFRKRQVVNCERCGQELTDPESIARGLGPECAMTQAAQFAAISNLTLAMSTGYFDQIAQNKFIEKAHVETRLAAAKREFNPAKIIKFTKHLQRLTGILVRRELQRQEKMQARKAVA
jgi:hypothetical protein